MKSIDDFVTLLGDQMGLLLTAADLDADLDEVAGWDSAQLLQLLVLLERETGRSIPVPRLLEARTLTAMYDLAVAG